MARFFILLVGYEGPWTAGAREGLLSGASKAERVLEKTVGEPRSGPRPFPLIARSSVNVVHKSAAIQREDSAVEHRSGLLG